MVVDDEQNITNDATDARSEIENIISCCFAKWTWISFFSFSNTFSGEWFATCLSCSSVHYFAPLKFQLHLIKLLPVHKNVIENEWLI